MKPICCNKPTTPYRKEYGGVGWEEGYRCKRCGRIRIPTEHTAIIQAFWLQYEVELGAIRLKGIEYDTII